MDMQEFVKQTIDAARLKRMETSDQLTLGEMILRLEPIVEKQKDRKYEATVCYDFGATFPVSIHSWRGSYAELALSYVDGGRGSTGLDHPLTVTGFLSMLKEGVGKTFTGYKGGDFTMSKDTPVWVANRGSSGNTAVIEIVDNGYEVIIMTGYREY